MLEGNELRLECLKLALDGANRAAAATYAESPKQVLARAQAYFDFVTGKLPVAEPKAAGYEFGRGELIGQGKPEK